MLGIADAPWTALPEVLRRSLSDYVRVPDLERYEGLEHAARLLVGRLGLSWRPDPRNPGCLLVALEGRAAGDGEKGPAG